MVAVSLYEGDPPERLKLTIHAPVVVFAGPVEFVKLANKRTVSVLNRAAVSVSSKIVRFTADPAVYDENDVTLNASTPVVYEVRVHTDTGHRSPSRNGIASPRVTFSRRRIADLLN